MIREKKGMERKVHYEEENQSGNNVNFIQM